MRMHHRRLTKLKNDYGWHIAVAICQQRIKPVTEPCRIRFTLIKPKTNSGVRDKQNLSLTEKIFTDWFVKKGVFKDDNMNHIINTTLDIIIDPAINEETIIYEAVEV
jgi:hypothetical protein